MHAVHDGVPAEVLSPILGIVARHGVNHTVGLATQPLLPREFGSVVAGRPERRRALDLDPTSRALADLSCDGREALGAAAQPAADNATGRAPALHQDICFYIKFARLERLAAVGTHRFLHGCGGCSGFGCVRAPAPRVIKQRLHG